MKKIVILVAGLFLLICALYFVLKNESAIVDQEPVIEVGNARESQNDYGYSFDYISGKDGYVVVTQENAPKGNLVFVQSVFVTKEYEELIASTIPREAPPALSIEVYHNPMNLEVEEWIKTTPASNFEESTERNINKVQKGNSTYHTYTYDGLYTTQVYVYAQDGYVYLFSNRWNDSTTKMYTDADTLLASIVWSTPVLLAQIAHGEIRVTTPQAGESITSPLTISGEARGTWFFEASFPVILTNWNGLIIAEGFATAQEDWMTEEFVPFTAELTFTKPDYNERGTLILKKENPSDLPEHDDAIEIPLIFQ